MDLLLILFPENTLTSPPPVPITHMYSVSVLSYYGLMYDVGRFIGLVFKETNLTTLHKEIRGFKL